MDSRSSWEESALFFFQKLTNDGNCLSMSSYVLQEIWKLCSLYVSFSGKGETSVKLFFCLLGSYLQGLKWDINIDSQQNPLGTFFSPSGDEFGKEWRQRLCIILARSWQCRCASEFTRHLKDELLKQAILDGGFSFYLGGCWLGDITSYSSLLTYSCFQKIWKQRNRFTSWRTRKSPESSPGPLMVFRSFWDVG